jgi:PKD domain-containing protein
VRHRLLLALTALAATFAPPALAADVTVAPAGGDPVTVSIAELEPSWDVRDRPYTVDGQQILVTGISIDRLLDRAGVDPFTFGDVTVNQIVLTRDQMIDPEAFPEGRPVFWVDAEGSHFLRPDGERAAGPFTIALAARGQLRVSATASRRRVETGERVIFTARVEGADGGVRVRWTFDDGKAGSGLRVRHAYERPGTYKVVVGATSEANPAGASAIVRVRVGEPAPAPDREGGGKDPDAEAPDGGAATGSREPPRRRGDEGLRATRQGRGDEGSPAEPQRRVRAKARPRERGDEVSGILLDDAGEPATAVTAAARTGNPEPAAPASELPGEALVALLALAMLAWGSWRETRPGAQI